MKSIFYIVIAIVLVGVLYTLYATTFPAGIGFSSNAATDLALQPCRPYSPAKRLAKNTTPTKEQNLTFTYKLGDIFWDTDNNSTNPSEIGNCVSATKLDEESIATTADKIRAEAVALTNVVETAKNYATSRPLNRFTRNIFTR